MRLFSTVVLLLLLFPSSAQTLLGSAFTYQGTLRSAGQPANGSYDFRFQLYDGPDTAANPVGSAIDRNGVTVDNGLFTVSLDFGAGVFNGDARWLEVQVKASADTGYTTLAPRQELTAQPYALESVDALSASWLDLRDVPAGFADGVDDTTATTAGEGLVLNGNVLSANWGGNGSATTIARSDHNHIGETWTGGNSDLLLLELNGVDTALKITAGYRAIDASVTVTDGVAVKGESQRNTGTGVGVVGVTRAPDGNGIAGLNYGLSTTPQGYGVYGYSISKGAIGIYGTVGQSSTGTAANSVGVWGTTDTALGVGVAGIIDDGTNDAAGEQTVGVVGRNNRADGIGVFGYAPSPAGTTVAVKGQVASPAGFAGQFIGNVEVQGTLSKTAGSFKIDHPLDPENKVLYHSFVESPDMKNIYDGMAVLNAQGEAVVQLPEWFEALNRDFRYQLTCVGGYAPVYIKQEIDNHRFVIAGGPPGLKVSWQVTGIRHDKAADYYRIPVEEDKRPEQRGQYLNPEAFGLKASRGVHALSKTAKQALSRRPDPRPGFVPAAAQ